MQSRQFRIFFRTSDWIRVNFIKCLLDVASFPAYFTYALFSSLLFLHRQREHQEGKQRQERLSHFLSSAIRRVIIHPFILQQIIGKMTTESLQLFRRDFAAAIRGRARYFKIKKT